MSKEIIFNTDRESSVRDKIREGVNIIAKAVKVTLGPTGRVVIFEREYGDPVITKDGVTVAREVDLKDPFMNMGAKMVRQAAAETAKNAGDGTTTATVLAEAIFEEGIKAVNAGSNPQEIKRGIELAVEAIVNALSEAASPVAELEQIKQVAVCSSNQDERIGSLIAEAMDKVGRDGVITIEEGNTLETTVAIIDGLQFPRGYMSPHFVTDSTTLDCNYEDPNILVMDDKLADIKSLLKVLETGLKTGKPLVLIAEDFSDDIISACVINRLRSNLSVVAVKAPGYGDRMRTSLEDIAIATGATVISKNGVSVDKLTAEHFGKCAKIKIDRDTTTILEGSGAEQALEDRIELLRSQLESSAGDFEREKLQERLARLSGGVAQISVGGATEAEVREKKDRIDDALNACKAAIEEGFLPGGGVASVHAKDTLTPVEVTKDCRLGIDIIMQAIEAPLRQIANNAGVDAGVVVNTVSSGNSTFGYNAAIDQYCDMIEAGIIVPTKVERCALQNAASVASLLLTTDCAIAICRDDQDNTPVTGPSGLPGGLGGMMG